MVAWSKQVIRQGRWQDGFPAMDAATPDAFVHMVPDPDADGFDSPILDAPVGKPAPSARRALLAQAVERDIIPRLVNAARIHGVAAASVRPVLVRSGPGPSVVLVAEDAVQLAGLAMENEGEALRYVEALRLRGAAMEALYLDLLAPAARHLGVLWEEDLCSFADVTVGLLRLQQALHAVRPAFPAVTEGADARRHALLVPLPGEQHSFGAIMVAEFMRRAGWRVWSGPVATNADLVTLVRTHTFALIGFSLACGDQLNSLAANIRDVRRASRNRAIGVMVGGPVFVAHPELVAQVGADATAADARQATRQADLLLAARKRGLMS